MKIRNQKVVTHRSGIEEWEMMLRLQYYYDENTAAAIIRQAKAFSIDGREAYSKDYVILYSGIYMNYSVFIINHEYDMLAADIDGIGQMKSPKTIRDYVSELVMYDGKLMDDSTVDTIMNCRLIDSKEKKRLFNKSKSIYSIVWDLAHTLLLSQRENKSLKKQVASLKYDLKKAKETNDSSTNNKEET